MQLTFTGSPGYITVEQDHRSFVGLMLGTDFGVVNTYRALFADNGPLLTVLTDDDFKLVAGWMRKMHQDGLRGARFIDLLSCLTISNGVRC